MKKGQKKGEALPMGGRKFGRLTVIALSGRGARRRYMWSCECECGGAKIVAQDLLISGKTKSCGCLIGPARLAHNKYPDRAAALFNLLYFSLTKRHKKKSGEPCITKADFLSISKAPCHYCGAVETNAKKDHRRDSRRGVVKTSVVSDVVITFNGIDRVDSGIGYTEGNCVSCCKDCNTAKNTLSQNEFMGLVRRIYSHWACERFDMATRQQAMAL